jgi:hypothetical protein
MKTRILVSLFVVLCAVRQAPSQIPASDQNLNSKIRADMAVFNPRYRELLAPRKQQLALLAYQVAEMEAQGRKVTCSHQILTEARWFMGYTADFARMDQRINDLRDSLAHPEREALAEQQDPRDGSWGGCFTEWWERLDASYDAMEMAKAKGIASKYRFSLLDRINSPEKLKSYFASIATSDIAHTGHDSRKELNFAFVNLIRLVNAGEPAGYPWHPQLKQTLMDLTLNVYRNQDTGWWGETYIRDGKREYVDDLSITFHIVQSLGDKVPLLDKLATTLFAVKGLDYPIGWTDHGVQSNHNNMDVIVLMRASWSSMTDAQRELGANEIRRMLRWCLSESLQKDGSFYMAGGPSDSMEEDQHFGVGFLARIGYFNKAKRFWTNEDFPEAELQRKQIIAFIRANQDAGAAGGTYYSSSLQELTQ